MKQQINFYQARFQPQTHMFPAWAMLQTTGILLLAMALMFAFAQQRVASIETEIKVVARQESVALERLQNIGPLIKSVTGETNWAEQLDESLRMLTERQAVLNLIQGTTLGDSQGFSHHLRALSRQNIEGVWLTNIRLSALGDKTRLQGRTIRAELIPLYVQNLAVEPSFAKQRFLRFQIESPLDDADTSLKFSMDSAVLLAAGSQ